MKHFKKMVLGLALLVGIRRGVTLCNEAAAKSETTRSAQHWKRKTAMAIGKPDLAEAPDEDLEAAHDAHMQAMANDMASADEPAGPAEVAAANTKVKDAETALTNEKTRATGLETDLVNEKTRATGLETELATAKQATQTATDALANERKVVSVDLIANALTAGLILPASKEKWEKDFATDFGKARTDLANAKTPVIKTKPQTGDVGERNNARGEATLANEEQRREQVLTLVNEKMAKNSRLTYDAAYDAVCKENPTLFEAMTKPEAAK